MTKEKLYGILETIFWIGFLTMFAFLLFIGFEIRNDPTSFCLRMACLEHWGKALKPALSVAKMTFSVLTLVATLGGIMVALDSYISNVRASAISNYLNHLDLFARTVEREISRLDRIDNKSIDSLKWYRTMHPDAKNGDLEISNDYKSVIRRINKDIDSSSYFFTGQTDQHLKYNDHQKRIKSSLETMGITISQSPRKGFYDTETQILTLIENINANFCSWSEGSSFHKRLYV